MDKHISMDTVRDILAEHYGSTSPETEAVILKIWDELDGAASDELSRRLEDLQRENAYLEQERAALWRWHDQREEKNRWRDAETEPPEENGQYIVLVADEDDDGAPLMWDGSLYFEDGAWPGISPAEVIRWKPMPEWPERFREG